MNDTPTPRTDALAGTGYTSGPWEINRRDDHHGNWIDTLILTASNHAASMIARVENPGAFADSKLLAAAPELADLARTLERELAARDATIAELREALLPFTTVPCEYRGNIHCSMIPADAGVRFCAPCAARAALNEVTP